MLFTVYRNLPITVQFIYLFLILGSDGKEERPAVEGAVSVPVGDILEQLHPVVPGRGQEVCYNLVFKTNSMSFKFLFIAVW